MRLLQWNVFEDGLADTPASIGFSSEFTARFSSLLRVLSDSGAGRADFYGFEKARDFSQLPDTVSIDSCAAFFGYIDIVYTIIYHTLGGEAILAAKELPLAELERLAELEAVSATAERNGSSRADEVPLGGSMRSIFLHSSLVDPAAVPTAEHNQWRMPALKEAESAAPYTAAALRDLRESVFEPLTGTLGWTASIGRRVWKRETLALCKWMGLDRAGKQVRRGVWAFAEAATPGHAAGNLSEATAAALSRMCRVGRIEGAIRALIELELDDRGGLKRLRTPSFQAAVRWLLEELVSHSGANPRVSAAVAAFTGRPAPEDPSELVGAIFAPLVRELIAWTDAAALEHRHAVVSRVIARAAPDIVTLAEHDDNWRALPFVTASGGRYAFVAGLGTASVLYDVATLELASLPGLHLPTAIRSAKERVGAAVVTGAVEGGGGSGGGDAGGGGGDGGGSGGGGAGAGLDAIAAPKNSCVVLLRRRTDGVLILTVALHLESGPPSDSRKVEWRAAQVRATLAEVDAFAAALSACGERALLVVGGDFNALREEFVHGNEVAFFTAASVAAVKPRLRPPAPGVSIARAPDPPFASLGPSGELRLRCPSCDGGWLVEASSVPSEAAASCTRAGHSMTIDYLLLGSVGGTMHAATPHRLVPAADMQAAADPSDGICHAVTHWGSDHLPVASDAELLASGSSAKDVRASAAWKVGISVAAGAAMACLAWRAARRH